MAKKLTKNIKKEDDKRRSLLFGQQQQENLQSSLVEVTTSRLKTQEKDDSTQNEVFNPSISEIYEQLSLGECTIFFYKITDGSFRRMKCTLQGVNPVPSKYNRPGIVVVWDLDTSNWRSFYPDRVFKLIRNEKTDIQ